MPLRLARCYIGAGTRHHLIRGRRLPPLEPRSGPAAVLTAGISRTPEHAAIRIVNRDRLRRTRATGCAAVATPMLGPSVPRTVTVDVPQIPRLASDDQPTAPSTRHLAGRYPRLPESAKTLVIRAVTPCDRLLRGHRPSTLKTGRDPATARESRSIARADYPPPIGAMRLGGVFFAKRRAGVRVRIRFNNTPPKWTAAARVHPARRGSARYGGVTHGCRSVV